jgi:Ran-binding protein 3
LFVLDVGEKGNQWRERGVGSFRLNVAETNSYARLLMRVEGSLRLVLNARLWPGFKIEKAGDKQVRFTATSIEKEGEMTCYLVRFAKADIADELLKTIEKTKELINNKDESTSTLPETTTKVTTASKEDTKEETA